MRFWWTEASHSHIIAALATFCIDIMGKTKLTRKFAVAKKVISAKDSRM